MSSLVFNFNVYPSLKYFDYTASTILYNMLLFMMMKDHKN